MTQSKRPIIILGSGGHAKVVLDVLKLCDYKVLGLVSPDEEKNSLCLGIKVLGNDDEVDSYDTNEILLANGIGSLPNKNLRWNLTAKFRAKGFEFVRVIHPTVIIASDVELAEGVQVMAGSIIQPGVRIEQDTIINTGSHIDHDCHIRKNCHLAPGATLSGNVNIGSNVHVGTGSKVIQNITIGENSVLAAGTILYKDLPSGVTCIQQSQLIIKNNEI